MVALSPEDKQRLDAAVAAAERQTGAEIVLAVADVCDDYAAYPLLWAFALGFLFAGGLALGWPETHVRFAFLGVGAFVLAVGLPLHWRPLRLLLVPRAIEQEQAARAAAAHFAAHVGGRTANANGLLIFVALGEHYVEIIPEAAIRQAIPETTWAEIVADMLADVKQGRLVDGLEKAVARCAAVLAGPFPCKPDDRNEIGDAVVVTRN